MTVEEVLQKLAALRKMIPGMDEEGDGPLNAEEILGTLAQLRKHVPGIDDVPRSTAGRSDGRSMLPDDIPAETEEDFEYAAVIDGLKSFTDDVSAAVDRMKARALEMRTAYERQYGRPIPEREEE